MILVGKHRIHGFPVYYANRESEDFTFLKRMDTIMAVKDSGLLEYLTEKCMPDAIVLFGSSAHGEDVTESDIDLFAIANEVTLDVRTFEKKLKRKISLFFSSDFNKLSSELKNNIINGIILKGYLGVF